MSFARICVSGIKGFFRGFLATVCREIPFAAIQFPLWEALKQKLAKSTNSQEVTTFHSAIAGFVAGGFAAYVTTPLDVIKTRTMLKSGSFQSPVNVALKLIKEQNPIKVLFSGAGPRTFWISVGGFLFLGSYQFVSNSVLQT